MSSPAGMRICKDHQLKNMDRRFSADAQRLPVMQVEAETFVDEVYNFLP